MSQCCWRLCPSCCERPVHDRHARFPTSTARLRPGGHIVAGFQLPVAMKHVHTRSVTIRHSLLHIFIMRVTPLHATVFMLIHTNEATYSIFTLAVQSLANFTILHVHDLLNVVAQIRQLSLFPVNLMRNITCHAKKQYEVRYIVRQGKIFIIYCNSNKSDFRVK